MAWYLRAFLLGLASEAPFGGRGRRGFSVDQSEFIRALRIKGNVIYLLA